MKRLWKLILAALALVVIATLAAIVVLQTPWFKQRLRTEIVSVTERVTGGKAELKTFSFDWSSLTARLDGFVLHGSEPRQSRPLFGAKSITVGLKVASFLRKDVRLASIVVDQPIIHIEVRGDGSTNVPKPKRKTSSKTGALEQIVKLRIGRFAMRQGELEVNIDRIPLTFEAENLSSELLYSAVHDYYRSTLASDAVLITSKYTAPTRMALNIGFTLEKTRFHFDRIALTTPKSKINISGILDHIGEPHLALNVAGQMEGTELGRVIKLEELAGGLVKFEGVAEIRRKTVSFPGKLQATGIRYSARHVAIPATALNGVFQLNEDGVVVNNFNAASKLGTIKGKLQLQDWHRLSIDGQASNIDVAQIGPVLKRAPLVWSGRASGPVHLQTSAKRLAGDLHVETTLAVSPGGGALPLSGQVALDYSAPRNRISFQNTRLNLPHSQAELAGVLGQHMQVRATSQDIADFNPVLTTFGLHTLPDDLTSGLQGGAAEFQGIVDGPLNNPVVDGRLRASSFAFQGQSIDRLSANGRADSNGLDLTALSIGKASMTATATGSLRWIKWNPDRNSPLQIQGSVRNANLAELSRQLAKMGSVPLRGTGSTSFQVHGTVGTPEGTAKVLFTKVEVAGQGLDQISGDLALQGDRIIVKQGRMVNGPAQVAFEGDYHRAGGDWDSGDLRLTTKTDRMPIQSIALLHAREPGLSGFFRGASEAQVTISKGRLLPRTINGQLEASQLLVEGVSYGDASAKFTTTNGRLTTLLSARLRDAQLNGEAQTDLSGDYQTSGKATTTRLSLNTISALVKPSFRQTAVDGYTTMNMTFAGPAMNPSKIKATIQIQELELSTTGLQALMGQQASAPLRIKNTAPIAIDITDGFARVGKGVLKGQDTDISFEGSVPFDRKTDMNAKVTGSLNLGLFNAYDKRIVSRGVSLVNASIEGTLQQPSINGALEVRNGSFYMEGLANGVTAANGVVKFDKTRATIQKFNARSGGGSIALSGFVTYGAGGPFVYRLEAATNEVRFRYAGGVSITSNASLRFTGTSDSSLLAGTVTVTRAALEPNADLGAIVAASKQQGGNIENTQGGLLPKILFDVAIESGQDFQFNTSLTDDVQAELSLTLRGTAMRPTLFGRISVSEGDVKVFGNKYTINRGEINFYNQVKIEPVLDVDLQTRARGVTVDVIISGSVNKLNVSYRSDPPFQSSEIIALLAVGRAPQASANLGGTQVTNDTSSFASGSNAFASGASTVLGQAFSPVSNRLQHLFGITNIKIDPLLQTLNTTPAARLTVEQEISKQVRVTYITNLAQTAEQIFRLEWSLNRQYSLIALRDENGFFGVDIQYRTRFK